MIVLVDDDPDFRNDMESLFAKSDTPIEVWSTYKEFEIRLARTRPSIMLLDINIGKESKAGLQALRTIKEKYSRIKTIVLTDYIDYVREAFKIGADGYLKKNEIRHSVEYIQQVVHDTKTNNLPITESVKVALVDFHKPFNKEVAYSLTDRERQIVLLAASDNNVPQIAEILNLKRNTVETYIKNAKQKLECHTIQGLVGRAFYHRTLDPDDLTP